MEIPDAEFSLWAEDKKWAPTIKYQEDLNIFEAEPYARAMLGLEIEEE